MSTASPRIMSYHIVYFKESHEEEENVEEETAVESVENDTAEQGEYFIRVFAYY